MTTKATVDMIGKEAENVVITKEEAAVLIKTESVLDHTVKSLLKKFLRT